MTLQTLNGGLIVPMLWSRGGNTAFAGLLLDADGEKAAYIVQAPKSGNLDRIAFRSSTVTSGANLDCRIETVSTSDGNPTGTLWATNTNCTVNCNASNTWFEGTLTASAAVTKGDLFAVVFVAPSGANLNISVCSSMLDVISGWGFPYNAHYTTSWAKGTSDVVQVAVRYDDGTYPNICAFPASAMANTQWNSSSNPDERGLYFSLPFPARLTGTLIYSTGPRLRWPARRCWTASMAGSSSISRPGTTAARGAKPPRCAPVFT
jgi:hypothetical protein